MCGDITCGNEIRKPTKFSVMSLNVGHGCTLHCRVDTSLQKQ
jgi:hypothetical protein